VERGPGVMTDVRGATHPTRRWRAPLAGSSGQDGAVASGSERVLLAAVRGYAADALGCSQDLVAAVHRFDGGNRHAVHKVSFSGGDGSDAVVVRVSYGTAAADRVQAAQEAKVLASVGGRAAPLLYDFRPTSHWFDAPAMCMQFVSGREMDLDAATPLELEQLGSVVAWVYDRHTADLVDGPSVPHRQLRAGPAAIDLGDGRLDPRSLGCADPGRPATRRRISPAAAPTATRRELLHPRRRAGAAAW
jgi:hypothetical protein